MCTQKFIIPLLSIQVKTAQLNYKLCAKQRNKIENHLSILKIFSNLFMINDFSIPIFATFVFYTVFKKMPIIENFHDLSNITENIPFVQTYTQ